MRKKFSYHPSRVKIFQITRPKIIPRQIICIDSTNYLDIYGVMTIIQFLIKLEGSFLITG